MPEYTFSYEYDPGDPNSIMMRVHAQLREEEMEQWRKKLEEVYKRGWDDCYFKLPLAGIPYPIMDNPYSKENFAKLFNRVENEFEYEGSDDPVQEGL